MKAKHVNAIMLVIVIGFILLASGCASVRPEVQSQRPFYTLNHQGHRVREIRLQFHKDF